MPIPKTVVEILCRVPDDPRAFLVRDITEEEAELFVLRFFTVEIADQAAKAIDDGKDTIAMVDTTLLTQVW